MSHPTMSTLCHKTADNVRCPHFPGRLSLGMPSRNFDRAGMDERFRVGGAARATNQILYNVTERGAEFDLMPLLRDRPIPTMAYSPVGQGRLPRSPALSAVAERHGVTPFQIALAWVLRDPGVIAIPKAADAADLKDNRRALDLALTAEDLAAIAADFSPPLAERPSGDALRRWAAPQDPQNARRSEQNKNRHSTWRHAGATLAP